MVSNESLESNTGFNYPDEVSAIAINNSEYLEFRIDKSTSEFYTSDRD